MTKEEVEAVVEFCMTRVEHYTSEPEEHSIKVNPDDEYWLALVEDDRQLMPNSRAYRNKNKEAWKALAAAHFQV